MVVHGLSVEAAVDLLAGGTVKIPDLEAEASRLDQGFSEGGDADVVGFALGGLDVVPAICLDVAHGDEVPKVVGMRLHPGTGKELHESADVAADKRAHIALP